MVERASQILSELYSANASADTGLRAGAESSPCTRPVAPRQHDLNLCGLPAPKNRPQTTTRLGQQSPARSRTLMAESREQDLGFMARVFAQMGLPHSNPGNDVRTFERKNGIYRLKLTAEEGSSLPYGSIPRVLLAFVGTEAVRTKSREIFLGENLSEFLRDKLHMHVSGGPRGTITAVREQAWRLFTCTVSVAVERPCGDEHYRRLNRMLITEDLEIWWTSKANDQASLWKSRLELSQKFFDCLIESPVPIDWNAVRYLSRSPLALDLYFWLTHRMSYLQHQTTVPWFGPGSLFEQLGSDYKSDRFGRRAFRIKIVDRLNKICEPQVWPECKLQMSKTGLVLYPSPTHIPRKLFK